MKLPAVLALEKVSQCGHVEDVVLDDKVQLRCSNFGSRLKDEKWSHFSFPTRREKGCADRGLQ